MEETCGVWQGPWVCRGPELREPQRGGGSRSDSGPAPPWPRHLPSVEVGVVRTGTADSSRTQPRCRGPGTVRTSAPCCPPAHRAARRTRRRSWLLPASPHFACYPEASRRGADLGLVRVLWLLLGGGPRCGGRGPFLPRRAAAQLALPGTHLWLGNLSGQIGGGSPTFPCSLVPGFPDAGLSACGFCLGPPSAAAGAPGQGEDSGLAEGLLQCASPATRGRAPAAQGPSRLLSAVPCGPHAGFMFLTAAGLQISPSAPVRSE